MLINTRNMVSITEANQNFTRVAKMAETNGAIYVLKNNKPILKISYIPPEEPKISDEELLEISARMVQRSRKGYEVLTQ